MVHNNKNIVHAIMVQWKVNKKRWRKRSRKKRCKRKSLRRFLLKEATQVHSMLHNKSTVQGIMVHAKMLFCVRVLLCVWYCVRLASCVLCVAFSNLSQRTSSLPSTIILSFFLSPIYKIFLYHYFRPTICRLKAFRWLQFCLSLNNSVFLIFFIQRKKDRKKR